MRLWEGRPADGLPKVGVPRFELGASPTRTERATRLRHTPRGPKGSGFGPRRERQPRALPRLTRADYDRGMAGRDEIVTYANELLDVERWPEFAPPGIQVVGSREVATIACGVSSSRALFEQAVALGADMIVVHHGLFWRNEPLVVDRRLRGRLEVLFRANASLVAYHLALDAHPELGNSAQLASRHRRDARRPLRRGRARMHRRPAADRGARRARQGDDGARAARLRPRPSGRATGGDLDRCRRLRPHPRRPRGLRRARHGGARGAEPARRPRARDPPDRGGTPRDGALRCPGAHRAPRHPLRDSSGTTSRSRTPSEPDGSARRCEQSGDRGILGGR